jgi:Putative prokaryotic signal transducing protein
VTRVVVRRFMNEAEADLARAILAANGIEAAVLRDDAGGMIPAMSLMSEIRLVVAPEDAEAAREVLDAGDG